MLHLFNTLTRKLEPFRSIKNKKAGMYSCGPTVYDFATIGNLRSYVFADILRRTLEFNGYKVKEVMNITDVGHLVADSDSGEEKIEMAAKKSGKSAWEIAKFYEQAFLADIKKLNIKMPAVLPRATAHIKEQIKLIGELEKKGFTYKTSDGIYFDASKIPDYGKLSGQQLEEKEAGARVEINSEKRNPWDFALWKFSPKGKKREMEWPSPWGKGFPGWHIECSAMSRKYLGQPFDIHTGGIDHVTIHHTNEIVQSEAAYELPLANFWMHGEFLLVNDRRMGKSEGNLITISEIEKRGINPMAYRYFVLGAHYRSKLNFTWEALAAASSALWNLRDIIRDWPKPSKKIKKYEEKFLDAINNDLEMPQALAVLWEVVKSDEPENQKAATVLLLDKVFGLSLEKYVSKKLRVPKEVLKLVREREGARAAKDFSKSDKFRKRVLELGFVIEDTPAGPKIRESRLSSSGELRETRRSTGFPLSRE